MIGHVSDFLANFKEEVKNIVMNIFIFDTN